MELNLIGKNGIETKASTINTSKDNIVGTKEMCIEIGLSNDILTRLDSIENALWVIEGHLNK